MGIGGNKMAHGVTHRGEHGMVKAQVLNKVSIEFMVVAENEVHGVPN